MNRKFARIQFLNWVRSISFLNNFTVDYISLWTFNLHHQLISVSVYLYLCVNAHNCVNVRWMRFKSFLIWSVCAAALFSHLLPKGNQSTVFKWVVERGQFLVDGFCMFKYSYVVCTIYNVQLLNIDIIYLK